MTVVREIWTSPELRITVLNKTLDPPMGEITMRVTSLDTSEPRPLLFPLLRDYKIVDETDPVKITYKRH